MAAVSIDSSHGFVLILPPFSFQSNCVSQLTKFGVGWVKVKGYLCCCFSYHANLPKTNHLLRTMTGTCDKFGAHRNLFDTPTTTSTEDKNKLLILHSYQHQYMLIHPSMTFACLAPAVSVRCKTNKIHSEGLAVKQQHILFLFLFYTLFRK